ncbi:MAG: PD40 domain-containing protein [Deltaproteobacteria bacterium]|nr:PD40 domain-containing protein [Deltaproteobacteria bacterium]
MLTSRPLVVLVFGFCLGLASTSQAGRALHVPQRLTAGASNQMMGELSPDGESLFFVSDRNATSEIFIQSPLDAGPRLLFDLNADVSWPKISPDGKTLAYISTREDALGDLCVFDLGTKQHSCLTDGMSAELQPLWFGQKRLGVLSRGDDLHGDFRLQRFESLQKGAKAETLLERNMLGAALSPSGQWLAYVGVERTASRVGVSFANRAGKGLRLERLDRKGKVIHFDAELPGTTGFPAFSADGKHLVFAQYLNDTNGDGQIDGDDNSVLFRVAFNAERGVVAGVRPEQLTSAQWNCRYPSPASDRLIMTCSHAGSLDIYSLPLEGAVPAAWTAKALRAELRSARDHWTELLLLGRLWHLAKVRHERLPVLKQMCTRHMELGELESAEFYAERAAVEGSKEKDVLHWAELMLELIAHRRGDRELTHGQLSDAYRLKESSRLASLQSRAAASEGDIKAMALSLASEVAEDLGQKKLAGELVAGLDLHGVSDLQILRLVAARLERIAALSADRQALLALHTLMAGHPKLDTLRRLIHGEAYVAELVRGLPQAERLSMVQKSMEGLAEDCELALVLGVAAELFSLDDANQEQVRKNLFERYKANRDVDRRRALVMATVRMASASGNEYLQYQFATSWASWLKRDHPERKYAEALFRKVVMERAYEEQASGDLPEARGYFFQTLVQTGDLEALMGFAEAWVKEGRKDLRGQLAKRYARKPNDPNWAFAQAYLIARDGRAMGRILQIDSAISLVAKAAGSLSRSLEVQHLWGFLLHQRHLLSRQGHDAISAHNHYLLALDLARERPRARASLLMNLGLLQASQGNHRIALRYFERRERLPQVRPDGELAMRMARARSLFFIDKMPEALAETEKAYKLLGSHKALEPFRPLVLDRMILYSLLEGKAGQAAKYLDLLASRLDGQPPIGKLKLELRRAWASMELGKTEEVLKSLDRAQAIVEAGAALRPERAAQETKIVFDKAEYRELLSGLRAVTLRRMGKLDAAAEAWTERLGFVKVRFEAGDKDEDLLDLARIQYHLAEIAHEQGRSDDAIKATERGLMNSAEFNQRSGSGVNPVGLRLIQAYVELALQGKLGREKFRWDVRRLLEMDYAFMCRNRSPNWESERGLFANYLTLLDLRAQGN